MITKKDFVKICSLPQYGLIPNGDKTSFYCNNYIHAVNQVTKYDTLNQILNQKVHKVIVYSECYCLQENKVETRNTVTEVTTKNQLIRSLDKFLQNYKLALIEFKKSVIEKDFK